MNIKNKPTRSTFLGLGLLFFVFTVVFTSASISAGRFPVGHDVVFLGVTIMAFCNAYLVPHFDAADERSKIIKEKGMYYSYFVLLGLLFILMTLFQFTSLDLNGFQTVSVVIALIMITVFSSFVVVSKRI